ncbi:nicotinamide-nucleotide adenylyltransferase [Candidatus Nitrosotenuis chungbukensis]|uniref:nicotinamide-nucleotide adenylyltransferase n=1 Tax=Candidatus Nitrosotenuis chungbukensis TaxID=1353246 RepID=UPI0026727A02|nr:nicotinamide-nucleotide adenylyltransferase [Candidatus Nitrosotenuis chungbukensis]WKT58468.1 nicotinamide-nucleotide adenylyltransferase [Candidatus Nitrosotenuis chungbukensis]
MIGLLIGRFQPFHIGHLDAVKFALSNVDELLIGIGKPNKSNEKRNPFTADERREMIESSLDDATLKKVRIYYIPDVDDHERWTYRVDEIVPRYDVVFSNDEFTHTLFGKRGVRVISVPLKQREILSGTDIRVRIKEDQDWAELVPKGTQKVLLKINAKNRLTNL